MYDINVTTEFTAVHCLRNYPEEPHEHRWKVTVTVRATELDEAGMGVDFLLLDRLIHDVIAPLDGQNFNDHPAFQKLSPSTEVIAKYLFDKMDADLRHKRYRLYSVTVWETPTQNVVYYGN
ncbi:MAG: 6-pyruvoyl tetrahydropterin synthase family protein [Bdellovibrionales bacterium]